LILLAFFEDAMRRIERANHHRKSLTDAWNSFIERDVYGFGLNTEIDGTVTLWAWPTLPIPDDFSLIIGEILYQYRAALDGVIYKAAVLETGKDPPPNENGLYFPVANSRKEFDNLRKRISSLPDRCQSFIETIQPYNAPQLDPSLTIFNFNRTIGILNDWARKDRHRRLHVIGSLASSLELKIAHPENVRVRSVDFIIKNEFMRGRTRIASFQIEGGTVGTDLYANPNLTIDISLDEGPPPCAENDTFPNRLTAINKAVKFVIGNFEKFFEIQG
jgi:hypothetical protein